MYKNHEIIKIADNMVAHGGSFVNAIGVALKRADLPNRHRLEEAFPDYFDFYLNIEK